MFSPKFVRWIVRSEEVLLFHEGVRGFALVIQQVFPCRGFVHVALDPEEGVYLVGCDRQCQRLCLVVKGESLSQGGGGLHHAFDVRHHLAHTAREGTLASM